MIHFPTYIVPIFSPTNLRRCARAGADVGKEVAEMAMMTKWQKAETAAADRAYARWDMLRWVTSRRVNIRRAWFVMGHKKSAPCRKH